MTLISLSIEKHVFACWFGFTFVFNDLLYSTNFDGPFQTIICKPSQYKLLTFHVRNPMSIFHSLDHLNKESFQVRGAFKHFISSLFFTVKYCYPHAQPPNWRTTPRQLFATPYSTNLQSPSISGGCTLYPQLEDAPCTGNTQSYITMKITFCLLFAI
jgi:hypothetical protein